MYCFSFNKKKKIVIQIMMEILKELKRIFNTKKNKE